MPCCVLRWSGSSRSSARPWRTSPRSIPDITSRISEHRRIIAFRNILIHGYADVDDRLVWDIVETKLPVLRREIESLLQEG